MAISLIIQNASSRVDFFWRLSWFLLSNYCLLRMEQQIRQLLEEKHDPKLNIEDGVFLLYSTGQIVHTKGGELLFDRSEFIRAQRITNEPILKDLRDHYFLTIEDAIMIRNLMLRFLNIKDVASRDHDSCSCILFGFYYYCIEDYHKGEKFPYLEKLEQKMKDNDCYPLKKEEEKILKELQKRHQKYLSIFNDLERKEIEKLGLPFTPKFLDID